MPHPTMTPELEKQLYNRGIELFNEHEFFEAHEAWEEIWRGVHGLKRLFYQGLIQCAVALVHYRRSNPRGVINLYMSYVRKFKVMPNPFMGLEVPAFLAAMKRCLDPVLSADPIPAKGAIALDLATTPTIDLIYDPFENGEAERYGKPPPS